MGSSGEGKREPLNRHMNLQQLEEEREDSDSHATSMAKSDHNNNFNQSGSAQGVHYTKHVRVYVGAQKEY